MSLQRISETLEGRLSSFAAVGAKVCFDLGEDGALLVDATTSPPRLSHGKDAAECTIKVSADDLEKLIQGSLNPTMAYTLGKLKVEGSMGIAMKVAALLED